MEDSPRGGDAGTEAPSICGCQGHRARLHGQACRRGKSTKGRGSEVLRGQPWTWSVSVGSVGHLATPSFTEAWEMGAVCVCPGEGELGLASPPGLPHLFGNYFNSSPFPLALAQHLWRLVPDIVSVTDTYPRPESGVKFPWSQFLVLLNLA